MSKKSRIEAPKSHKILYKIQSYMEICNSEIFKYFKWGFKDLDIKYCIEEKTTRYTMSVIERFVLPGY